MKTSKLTLNRLSVAVLSVMASAPLLALESASTSAVHGRQITTTGAPVIERTGPQVQVTTLPTAQDEDSTDTHAGWRYVWQVAGSDVAAEAPSPGMDAVPAFSARLQDYDNPVRVCLKAVASSGYPVATQTSEQVCSGEMMLTDSAPTASNVTITGTLEVGQTLTGDYTFADAEGDVEDGTTFQWYRADDAAGTSNKVAISGATGKTYTAQVPDRNKYLIFEVTPRAATGKPTQGAAVSSAVSAQVRLGMIDNFSGPDGVMRTWDGANDYCNSLTQHGFSDWRLPASSELLSLYGRHPGGDINAGHGWSYARYWSTELYQPGYHYLVDLHLGRTDYFGGKDNTPNYVTCVR